MLTPGTLTKITYKNVPENCIFKDVTHIVSTLVDSKREGDACFVVESQTFCEGIYYHVLGAKGCDWVFEQFLEVIA